MNCYRNKIEVCGVEPEALWKLDGNDFVLEDEDQYTAVDASDYSDLFYRVELEDKSGLENF